eukprot:6184681-Pleurochrysis_carterae.AAC.1
MSLSSGTATRSRADSRESRAAAAQPRFSDCPAARADAAPFVGGRAPPRSLQSTCARARRACILAAFSQSLPHTHAVRRVAHEAAAQTMRARYPEETVGCVGYHMQTEDTDPAISEARTRSSALWVTVLLLLPGRPTLGRSDVHAIF